MIKRIIFDIDDTLITFPKDYEIGYQKIIDKYSYNFTAKQLYSAIGEYENRGEYKRYNKTKMVDLLKEYFKLDITMDFFDSLIEEYNSMITPVSTQDIETLKYLSKKYELYALTNYFTKPQEKRMEKAGIKKFFKKIYGADIVDMKPNITAFREVMGDLKEKECLVIGDSQTMDIEVPHKMGMNVIHFNGNGQKYKSIQTISELKELL